MDKFIQKLNKCFEGVATFELKKNELIITIGKKSVQIELGLPKIIGESSTG